MSRLLTLAEYALFVGSFVALGVYARVYRRGVL